MSQTAKNRGRNSLEAMRALRAFLALIPVLWLLSACAAANIPDAKPTTGRTPTVAEVPNGDETVRGDDDPPIVTLELGSALHARHLSETEDLPSSIIIPTTNLNATPVSAALQAVLAGTDVSLSWDTASLGDRLVTVMNLSGPLPKVVEKICSAARVFCLYRHGSLELQDKDTFIVGLPPSSKNSPSSSGSSSGGSSGGSGGGNSMSDTIAQMVGGKVQLDTEGGNIIYTAGVDAQNRIEKYLSELRNGRPLVVIQLYIWEVVLDKENAEGINWSALKLSGLGPGFAKLGLSSVSNFAGVADAGSAAASTITTGGVSLGAVTTGRLNTNALLTFLATQGRVQTISNPQITFISGSGAQFKVGGKQRYISQVGQLVAANNVTGTTNPNQTTGVGTNTVNTDSIDTGLTVNINGAYENGVVFANLDLALTNLVGLNPTQSGGETIDLPQTTDEKISTIIRVRPGDNLVMAGLVTSKDTNTRQGIPFMDDTRIPTYGDDQLENHELVVVVKPSVVLFSDTMSTAQAKKKEQSRPLPDAVVIDKDGSKTIAMPGPKDHGPLPQTPNIPVPPPTEALLPERPETPAQPQSQLLPPAGSQPQPELMTNAGNAEPTAPIPIAPGTDDALVDRRLMQRGFSHAFDSLLQTEPSNIAASGGEKP